MGHHHNHNHSTKNIKAAFFLNLIFTLIELIGGFYTNSMAILSDALHDLGDSFSLGISWYFQKVSAKGRTKRFSYGYGRFSLMGAFINSAILLTGSVIIIYESIPRLINPSHPDTQGMIILAIIGVIVNGAAVLKLKKGTSVNEKVVALHLLEDVLGWVAVLIGAIVMHYYQLPIIDPILSIIIAVYILFNVYKNIKKSLHIVLQGTPENVKIDEITQQIGELHEIKEIHDCHMWTLDGEQNIFSSHLVVPDNLSMEELAEIKDKVRDILKSHDINHATLEFETEDEDCKLEDC